MLGLEGDHMDMATQADCPAFASFAAFGVNIDFALYISRISTLQGKGCIPSPWGTVYAVLLTSQFTNAPGCRVRSVEQHRNRIEGAGGIQLRACGSIPLPQGPDRRKAEYAGFDPYYQ